MTTAKINAMMKKWREMAVDDSVWRPTEGERPGGEAAGFWVEKDGIRGYLKPSKIDGNHANHPRAAHEKIAADLAFDLGLPVSPAVLVDGKKCSGLVSEAVVSLVMFPEVHKWSHIMSVQASKVRAIELIRDTAKNWSGIVAFDAWLANTDRANDGNVLVGIDSESPNGQIVFCDFANCMIHSGWRSGQTSPLSRSPMLKEFMDLVDLSAVREMAQKIRDFPADTIDTIVNRMPVSHLQEGHKGIIASALKDRQKRIPGLFIPMV